MAIVISMDFGNRFFKLDMKIRVCHNFFSIPFNFKVTKSRVPVLMILNTILGGLSY